MLLLALASFVSVAAAQTFSIGIGLGGAGDVIPAFDSQRSSSATTSSQNRNPFTSFSGAGGSNVNFEDFFSSSRIATPQSSPDARSRSPVRIPAQSPARSFLPTPAPTSTTSSARVPARSPSSASSRGAPSPNPVITSRGAPVAPASAPVRAPPAREITRHSSSFQPSGLETSSRRESSSFQGSSSQTPLPSRPRGGAFETSRDSTVQAVRDVSSRGREQDLVPRQPPVTRPPTTTETNEVDPRENLVGQSICARGSIGDACRKHLANTALSCTSGFCHECQQCGNMSPDLWPKCCREHFLCCRPLARGCQDCDKPALKPFCSAAFGRCN